jgi:formylmethanofuran dehydrogenase subunit D
MEAEVTIVIIRDIFQDEAAKKSRFTDEYRQLSALIILDKQNMLQLGAKDSQRLKVENHVGRIVVAAKTSEDDSHPGLAFMYISPWSNQLISDDVCATSTLGTKSITARLSLTGENITQISEIMQRMRA